MSKAKVRQIEKQIETIKEQLQEIGEMRPGSLTQQYKVPKEKIGPYYQLSYMHKMKSRTEYVRPQFVAQIKQQVASSIAVDEVELNAEVDDAIFNKPAPTEPATEAPADK